MTRHVPTPEEQAAIALLSANGYEVLRARSVAALRERVVVAEARTGEAREMAASAERWAHRCLDEQDRLRTRIDDIVEFALRNGVTIDDLIRFNEQSAARRRAAQGAETPSGAER